MTRLVIRRSLLSRGLISWLVCEYLARTDLNMYGLEYSTALLMNLCLHQAGKAQCVPLATNVLDILINLLVKDFKQVMITPYFSCLLNISKGFNIILSRSTLT